ncbi:acyl-coenzyme A amino acid N-acyltransferase 1-like [Asterias rubens]|uniref:acyl-coenzyme A amino acid N-acyltransferase 1-like n=1 Tax=Asterias rubens TaxID=7604 RepID=UPI001455725D|nr:acyl-coenzyme A amino acid N-acyltransferase 1-like [Asterias rubens]XP_033635549.1 acyl-coenzyme A amino acid N-acyltransferase 1-like [Asterias rubens]
MANLQERQPSKLAQTLLLSVTPSTSMIDQQVAIKATGMKANSYVTIRAVAKKKTGKLIGRFESYAHYKADENGEVSVADQACFGGSYTGIEPMGLFWSMVPSPGERLGARFILRDATKPMVVQLSLYEGQLDTAALQTKEPKATAAAERWYMGKDVERIEVEYGQVRGALFKPKGPGPFPGVIDMFGTAGGLIEIRAAALASHGFASYALPYFAYKDLPTFLWNRDAEYFRDAIDWLCDQPYVKPGGVGIVGVSAGATLALQISALFPEKVSAVISINGSHAFASYPLNLNGEELPYVTFECELLKEPVKDVYDIYDCWHKLYELQDEDGTIIKLEKNPKCQYLFLAGEAERQWDSVQNAKISMERLKRHGCSNYQLLSYPEAGHLLEIPWAPVGSRFWSPAINGVLEHGGTPVGNIRAMEDSWPKMIRFLRRHCGHCNSKL